MEHWLTEVERDEVIRRLILWGLVKWDNARKLPLKSGGTTDVYVMLRNMRNVPESQKYLGWLYANPIGRLRADRFIEVPTAVSGLASQISTQLNIPYVTVRDQPKIGRVAAENYIGEFQRGEVVPIVDDVITDGASKIIPYNIAKCYDVHQSAPVVVLCDRQQGWRKKFIELGIECDVWSAMTLHHIRRYLIEHSFMERCAKEVEEKNPLIIALDNRDWEEGVLSVVDPLRTSGCILKVNDLIFNEGIKNLVSDLQVYGRVMVDLKSHDIPHTVANIMKHLLPCPPWAVTVHASGSKDMVSAAVKTLAQTSTKVLAITVLTSFDEATCEEVYHRLPPEQVEVLAQIACDAGAHGFVCSPEEVNMLKKKYPQMICVTPGIRSAGSNVGDQKRIATPQGALDQGSDYLVMGRQILGAADPVQEVQRLLQEEIRPFA